MLPYRFTAVIASLACVGALSWAGLQEPKPSVQTPDSKPPVKPPDKKPPSPVFTSVAEAGPDYQVQGEYVGVESNGGKLAAQVVARGDGKFDVYLLPGGLPGDGWNGKDRHRAAGVRGEAKTAVTGKDFSGEIAADTFAGTLAGRPFTLKRVHRTSPTLGAKPPQGAIVLFDGTGLDHWNNGKLVEENLLHCGTSSKTNITVGTLHVEFRTPFKPTATGQARGNSGVFVHGVEIQVLDSFGLTGEKNECGALYGQARPAVNMCLPPLVWQTYDVEIKPGKSAGTLLLTVLHNGVKVHEDFEIKGSPDKPRGINLQNHGNPVVYRNIWFAPAK